jgi:hypothetical protein
MMLSVAIDGSPQAHCKKLCVAATQSRSLEALGIQAELATAEVQAEGVESLISAVRGSLDELNAIRTQLLLTVGADAG